MPRRHVRRSAPTLHCDDCGGGPFTPRGLASHQRMKHSEESSPAAAARQAPAPPPRAPRPSGSTEAAIRAEGDKLVTNLGVVGMFLSAILPTTGTTLLRRLSDRPLMDAGGQPVLIDDQPQYKRGIGSIIMDAARRDERIFSAVEKFNRIFEVNDALEIGLSLAGAVAVDVGVDPDIGFDLGPVGKFSPIRQLIPDVLEDLYGPGGQEQPEPTELDELRAAGAVRNGAVNIPGGVEAT